MVGALAWVALACIEEPGRSSDRFADVVVRFEPGEGASFGHEGLPGVVLGAPGGTLDVASLGCEGEIVLGFEGAGVPDGPGPDLVVFENPFSEAFPEPGEVSVSVDGETWFVFACDPVTLEGCAGVGLTLADPGSGIDPGDPELAGGDAFDLSSLAEAPAEVFFVRVVDRSREYWSARGQDYCDPGQGGSGGFDLDAVVAVHG